MNTKHTTRTEGPQPGPSVTGAQALDRIVPARGRRYDFRLPRRGDHPRLRRALYDYRDRLRHILVRHEQGAVHAAQGYARVSGRVGVCLVTSGPGATNTVTGLADA